MVGADETTELWQPPMFQPFLGQNIFEHFWRQKSSYLKSFLINPTNLGIESKSWSSGRLWLSQFLRQFFIKYFTQFQASKGRCSLFEYVRLAIIRANPDVRRSSTNQLKAFIIRQPMGTTDNHTMKYLNQLIIITKRSSLMSYFCLSSNIYGMSSSFPRV